MFSAALLKPIGLVVPVALLGVMWWSWPRNRSVHVPKWRATLFFSGLCAGTGNFLVLGIWMIWLHYHYAPSSYRAQDIFANVGISLLLYSVIAALGGRGKYRLMLAISGILSIIVWLPVGV